MHVNYTSDFLNEKVNMSESGVLSTSSVLFFAWLYLLACSCCRIIRYCQLCGVGYQVCLCFLVRIVDLCRMPRLISSEVKSIWEYNLFIGWYLYFMVAFSWKIFALLQSLVFGVFLYVASWFFSKDSQKTSV